jgi:hypothetical protein
MKTNLTQVDWDRICWLIENECKPGVYVVGTPEEGYYIKLPNGIIHPAAFLDLFDGHEERLSILKSLSLFPVEGGPK